MKRIVQFILIFTLILSPFLYIQPVKAAADFEINSDLNITYESGNDFVNVKESVDIQVNNKEYFYKPGIIQYFYISDSAGKNKVAERKFKLKNLSIENSYGVKMDYKKSEETNGISIQVTIPTRVDSSSPYTLTMRYKTHDLINKSGNIINMYVPALPIDTKFSETGKFGLTTSYEYSAKLILPTSFPTPSYTQPSTLKLSNGAKNSTVNVPASSRIGHTSWLQFGDTQYYKFKIVQIAKKTDNLTPTAISNIAPISSTNIYKLALPREYDETGQNVLINSIDPKPKSLERDAEGNLIASFDVAANADTKIIIEGLISLKSRKTSPTEANLTDYKSAIASLPNLTTYTQSDKYWESNDPLIIKTAQELLAKSSSILELINNDYKYVIDKFTYSNEKLANGNQRLGAKEALITGQATCMEYADTLIAILRAQGVPARAAIGYGNDPTGIENNISNTELLKQTIGHQWVQVWIPDYGWLSVDPTWGESGRQYIGSDLDHILWYTIGSNEQNIADTTIYSADVINSEENKADEVYLQALTDDEYNKLKDDGQTATDLITKYSDKTSILDLYIKTTLVGRIFVYLIPIFVVVIFSLTISTIIFKIVRRKYKVKKDQ
jgi:transglutaminase-like putative cysteine protease